MTKTAAGIIAAVVAGIALIAFLAGGGGGEKAVNALDPVAQAADTTTGLGSAEVGIAASITSAGQTIPLNGSATIDTKNLRAHMSFTTQFPGAGSATIDEIMNGGVIFVHMPAQLASGLPGGKQWIKFDLQALGKKSGLDFQKLMKTNAAQNNPANFLQYLKGAGSSRVVGHEGIRGVATTHYRATIDVNKTLGQLHDAQSEQSLRQLYAQAGVSSLPIDVWIDRAGRVRRESFDVSLGREGSMSMTIEFIRFGVQVDASPPPSDQVFDVTSLVSSAGG